MNKIQHRKVTKRSCSFFIFHFSFFISAALLMSGCGLYTKYERPEVNTKGLVRDVMSITDTLAVTDTASFGNLPWRSVFTDPQLQTLIERGLENNADLLNAALNVKMVEEALKVAKLAFIPSLAFTPQGTIASFDGAKPTKSYTLPISASWNVDLFGNLLNTKRSAQMQLLATKDYQTVVKTNIISGIARCSSDGRVPQVCKAQRLLTILSKCRPWT